MTAVLNFAVIATAYVLAHGLTALLITPLQARVLPEITTFASLLYLPHGVRVLATWLVGKAAFAPLFAGAFLAEVIFTPGDISSTLAPVMLMSITVGAVSALVAFEAMALAGYRVYAGPRTRVHWKWLLLAGALASLINSLGQSLVFSGDILPDHSYQVLAVYAVGDMIGLIATTLILMMIFRWVRLLSARA